MRIFFLVEKGNIGNNKYYLYCVLRLKYFSYSTLDYGLWTLVMIDWLISTRKITKTFNISPLEQENGKLK